MSIADRLKQARTGAGYATAEEFAQRAGVSATTYRAHEAGTRGLKIDVAKKYARLMRVEPEYLLTGRKQSDAHVATRPLVGLIGAGGEVIYVDDHARGASLEEVEAPPGADPETVALLVRGDSQYPVYRDGYLVFYKRTQNGVPDACIGEECIVRLADGRAYLKILERGAAGLFDLISYNAPREYGVRVEWAAVVEFVDRRKRFRPAETLMRLAEIQERQARSGVTHKRGHKTSSPTQRS